MGSKWYEKISYPFVVFFTSIVTIVLIIFNRRRTNPVLGQHRDDIVECQERTTTITEQSASISDRVEECEVGIDKSTEHIVRAEEGIGGAIQSIDNTLESIQTIRKRLQNSNHENGSLNFRIKIWRGTTIVLSTTLVTLVLVNVLSN